MKQTIKRLVEVCMDNLKDGEMLLEYAQTAKDKEQHDIAGLYHTQAVERYKDIHDAHALAEKYITMQGIDTEKTAGPWCCMHEIFMEDVKEFGENLAKFPG